MSSVGVFIDSPLVIVNLGWCVVAMTSSGDSVNCSVASVGKSIDCFVGKNSFVRVSIDSGSLITNVGDGAAVAIASVAVFIDCCVVNIASFLLFKDSVVVTIATFEVSVDICVDAITFIKESVECFVVAITSVRVIKGSSEDILASGEVRVVLAVVSVNSISREGSL